MCVKRVMWFYQNISENWNNLILRGKNWQVINREKIYNNLEIAIMNLFCRLFYLSVTFTRRFARVDTTSLRLYGLCNLINI